MCWCYFSVLLSLYCTSDDKSFPQDVKIHDQAYMLYIMDEDIGFYFNQGLRHEEIAACLSVTFSMLVSVACEGN